MYVGPLQTDCYAADGMREIAIVVSNYDAIFLRIFGKTLDLYKEDLKQAEYTNAILEASNMEVDHTSSKFITLIYYVSVSSCRYINYL